MFQQWDWVWRQKPDSISFRHCHWRPKPTTAKMGLEGAPIVPHCPFSPVLLFDWPVWGEGSSRAAVLSVFIHLFVYHWNVLVSCDKSAGECFFVQFWLAVFLQPGTVFRFTLNKEVKPDSHTSKWPIISSLLRPSPSALCRCKYSFIIHYFSSSYSLFCFIFFLIIFFLNFYENVGYACTNPSR